MVNPINWDAARIREENAIEYEHRPKVVQFPGTVARANAAYSAQLLEEDRVAVRRDQIVTRLEELYAERARINCEIFDLECEQKRLRGGSGV